jgi:hypothetical protein
MLTFTTLFLFSCAAIASVVVADHDGHDHDHDHEHEESCACVAKELGFTIDCKAQAAITAAFKVLKDSGCAAAKCKTDAACKKAFSLVQAHHDHCFTDQVPSEVETGLHLFEQHCEMCIIAKQFMPSRPVCPTIKCTAATSFTDAHTYLKNNNCSTTCTSTECAANFRIIRAAHDTCEHDDLPTEIEEAIHTFEDVCTEAECNTASAAFTPTCTDDHRNETTAAPSSSAELSLHLPTFLLVLAGAGVTMNE